MRVKQYEERKGARLPQTKMVLDPTRYRGGKNLSFLFQKRVCISPKQTPTRCPKLKSYKQKGERNERQERRERRRNTHGRKAFRKTINKGTKAGYERINRKGEEKKGKKGHPVEEEERREKRRKIIPTRREDQNCKKGKQHLKKGQTKRRIQNTPPPLESADVSQYKTYGIKTRH